MRNLKKKRKEKKNRKIKIINTQMNLYKKIKDQNEKFKT